MVEFRHNDGDQTSGDQIQELDSGNHVSKCAIKHRLLSG